MSSRLRDRLGTPAMIVAVIALVFALMGAAYAASGALTGKQKKEVEKIAKKYAGKPGAPGTPGSNGKDGANGTNGTNGAPGAPGANGKSVKVTAAPLTKCEERGGVIVEKEGEASSAKEVCNGKPGPEGSPWTVGGTLPPGALESGSFSFHGTEAENPSVSGAISFPIRLGSEMLNGAEILPRSRIHVLGVDSDFEAACESQEYPSTFAVPNAKPGEVCILPALGDMFESEIRFVTPMNSAPALGEAEGLDPVGGIIYAKINASSGRGSGTFAARGCAGSTGPNACP